MSKKVLPSSLRKVLHSHTVPGQFHSLFQPDAGVRLQVVKTKEKREKTKTTLDYLIPQIQSLLLQMRSDKTLNKLFKGIKFTKIEADSKLLCIYYSPSSINDQLDRASSHNDQLDRASSHNDQLGGVASMQLKGNFLLKDDAIRGDLESLLYKYLVRQVSVKKFPSKLELKRDYISPLLLNVEKELKDL